MLGVSLVRPTGHSLKRLEVEIALEQAGVSPGRCVGQNTRRHSSATACPSAKFCVKTGMCLFTRRL